MGKQQHLEATLTPAPKGFDLGLNEAKAAGQTMPQFHFHVIPRHSGDVPDPRGGRAVGYSGDSKILVMPTFAGLVAKVITKF